MARLIEQHAEVDRQPVVFLRAPAPRGPSLVLIHGAGHNHRSLAPLGEALGALDVILPSLPGRAGSGGPPLASVAEMAAWVNALTRALGVESSFLAGHSLGGAVAMQAALAAGLAGGLVLMATGARLRVHPAILEAIEQAADRGEQSEADAAYHPLTPAETRRQQAEAQRLTPPLSALVDWRAAHQFDQMGAVGSLAGPALVLVGQEDPLTPPRYARYLAEHIPQATLVIVEGASHMLPIEQPRKVAPIIEAFVLGHGG